MANGTANLVILADLAPVPVGNQPIEAPNIEDRQKGISKEPLKMQASESNYLSSRTSPAAAWVRVLFLDSGPWTIRPQNSTPLHAPLSTGMSAVFRNYKDSIMAFVPRFSIKCCITFKDYHHPGGILSIIFTKGP